MADQLYFLEKARELDATDPLSDFRSKFLGLHDDLIYLDGNSLGPLPAGTSERLQTLLEDEWGNGLIRSWNSHWYDLPTRLGDLLAPLIGANAGEVCFCDSVTVNLFKLASAALGAMPDREKIVTDTLNFPSDYYALEGLIGIHGNRHILERIPSDDGITIDPQKLVDAIDTDTVLVTLSHVVFKSGFMHELEPICEKARKMGALVLVDLSHSVGSVPIDLSSWGVDLAVGCSYKYLNGGPGSTAFLYVRKELQDQLQPQLAGWLGSDKPFDFDPHYKPIEGIRRFLVGTPPIVSLQAVEQGIRLLLEAGMDQVRAKSIQQTELLLDLYDAILEPLGFSLGSPRDSSARGSHVSFKHSEAFRINKAMIHPPEGKPCIIPDFRTPNNLRLGIAPLFISHEDIVRAVYRIQEIVVNNEYTAFSHESAAVT
ncbi:MAG: kynureninase [Puniceicoccaceae bacterium]